MRRTKVPFPPGRPRAWLVSAAFAALWIATGAPVAGAQGPGVVFEPGSPSYKEYSIPLEQARRDAGGGIPGSVDSRAFGIGLSARAAEGDGASPGDAARGGSGPSRPGRGGADARRDARPAPGSLDLRERLSNAESVGTPFLWQWAPLLLVLVPGLFVGLLLAVRGGGDGRHQPA